MKKVKIGDVLQESRIESLTSNPNKRITVRLNLKGVEKRPLKNDTKGATKYYTRKQGQFIYGKQNLFKGAFGIIPKELDGYETSSDLPCFDVDKEECLPEWILYFLIKENFYKKLEKIARGAGSKRISPKDFYNIEMPLPSLTIQKQIINKFIFLEKKGINLINEIESQQSLLKKLRQSILQEAIEGKLTASWREENRDIESASVLLEKIKSEKEQLIKEKKIKKQKALLPINEDEIPFDIPDGWVWCRLGELCDFITKGTTPPKFELVEKSEIPYLKVYNIVNQKINFEYKPQFINREIHEKLLYRSRVFPNDVLMNIVGPPLGKIALVPNEYPEWNINQAIAIFRAINAEMSNYIYYYLREGRPVRAIELKGVVGQDNISLTQSRELIIALPPLQEQKQIVKKIESLFKICDELEEKIAESKKSSEMLMQSVLREAFVG